MSYPNPDLCPPFTKECIDRWVRYAQPTGHFLSAVLSNDLKEAVARADSDNLAGLVHIVAYLYNRCPSGCWGSPERVREWPVLLAKKGIDSFEHEPEVRR